MDLIDFFLENNRWKTIGPLNEIKSANFKHTYNYTNFSPERTLIVRKKFKNYGVCKMSTITKISDLEELTQYYLPWYKPNSDNQMGYNIKGSINYKFDQYIVDFAEGKEHLLERDKIAGYIQSHRNGWKVPIEIIVAFDTSINVGLIVDGTHRSLALYYLYVGDGELLRNVLTSNMAVNMCVLESEKCKNLFPYDFRKLISYRRH